MNHSRVLRISLYRLILRWIVASAVLVFHSGSAGRIRQQRQGKGAVLPLIYKRNVLPKCIFDSGSKVADCDANIRSEQSVSGELVSPSFPNPYPGEIHCTYVFRGKPHERVQILFTDFDLYMPQNAEHIKDCESVDAVMVFIVINGQKERVDNFCGKTLPQQLMSNGPLMTIEFISVSKEPDAKGFRALYKFTSNFGITSGRQQHKSECYFIFNSTERSNGTFSSPNWPGFYPRDTECHYLFYGRSGERVFIAFAYFDVEGVPPCDADTASDFVEFSNYRSVDRKIPKHCGMKKPRLIESDGEFFRVTFKSNDKFDGTGFEAFYQFRNNADPFSIQRVAVFSCAEHNRSALLFPTFAGVITYLVASLWSSGHKTVLHTAHFTILR